MSTDTEAAPRPKARIVTIDPQMAEDLVTHHNPRNRDIKATQVNKFANQMLRDEFLLTGESVILDVNRNIIDGQHRLYACIQSGKPFRTILVENVDPEVFRFVDTGTSRTARDLLDITGLAASAALAATARSVMWAQQGGSRRSESEHISNADVHRFSTENEEALRKGIELGQKYYARMGLNRTKWNAFATLTVMANPEAAEKFADMAHEIYANPPSAIRALHSWATSIKPRGRSLKDQQQIVGAAKAWNAWVEGKEVQRIRVSTTERDVPELVVPGPQRVHELLAA